MKHYQKASGDGTHVFYNSITAFTFVGQFGNNWFTSTLDFFNPISDIKDLMDLFYERDSCVEY